MKLTDIVHCECGEARGVPCEWTGPASETVVVEWMPHAWRESHRAAGNSGSYPHNGSERLVMQANCAAAVVENDPDWAEVIT